MIKRLLVLPLVAGMLVLLAPSGWADSYSDTIVGQLNAGSRVVVDKNANPMLPNPETINSQILQTGLPMVVVNIAKSQTNLGAKKHANLATDPIRNSLYDTHNALTNPIQVNGQPHKPPLIILVTDGTGYHAWAYDVTQSIASAAGPNILQAAEEHHDDLNGAVSAFISLMASTPNTGPVVSNEPAPPAPINWGLWLFVALAIVGVVLVVRFYYRGHREKIERRDRVRNRINVAEADVNNLAEEVLKGEDVSGAQNRATSALADAKDALDRDDIADAASKVGIAETEIQLAYQGLSHYTPSHSHVVAFEDDVPKHARKKATVTATSPKGNWVTISNNDYRTQPESGYRNYYRGGTYNAVYFYPGYYPYPFWAMGWGWSPTDVILTDELLADHSDGGSAAYTPAPSHHSSSSGSSSGGDSAGFAGGFGVGGFDVGSSGGGGFDGGSSGGGSAGF